MKATHALVNLDVPLRELVGFQQKNSSKSEVLDEEDNDKRSQKAKDVNMNVAEVMQLEEDHNPNDVLRRHLSWVRTRRAVVDALLACCKIEHESSLLSFHLSLLDSPLEVCYSFAHAQRGC